MTRAGAGQKEPIEMERCIARTDVFGRCSLPAGHDGETHENALGETFRTLMRLDTPENRAYWKFVQETSDYVRTHVMCFSNWCSVPNAGPCPKAAVSPEASAGSLSDSQLVGGRVETKKDTGPGSNPVSSSSAGVGKWQQVGNPRVRGRCPACGADSLFLGNNGYVTCAVIGCKDPGAATDLLAAALARSGGAEEPQTVKVDRAEWERLQRLEAAHNSLYAWHTEVAWQPIETAPKDGRRIVAWMVDTNPVRDWMPDEQRHGPDSIYWTDFNGGGWVSHHPGTPTHWFNGTPGAEAPPQGETPVRGCGWDGD